MTLEISGSCIFCGFSYFHRINPVSAIKNLLKQIEKLFLNMF